MAPTQGVQEFMRVNWKVPGQCSLIWIAVTFVFLNKCAGLKEVSSFLINAEVLEYDLGLVPITLFLFLLLTIPS